MRRFRPLLCRAPVRRAAISCHRLAALHAAAKNTRMDLSGLTEVRILASKPNVKLRLMRERSGREVVVKTGRGDGRGRVRPVQRGGVAVLVATPWHRPVSQPLSSLRLHLRHDGLHRRRGPVSKDRPSSSPEPTISRTTSLSMVDRHGFSAEVLAQGTGVAP